MEIIQQANNEVLDFLGGLQKYDEKIKYRKSTLIITEPVNNEVIAVFNTLTNFCIYLTNEEWENAINNKDKGYYYNLIESYTLVPEGFNENEVIDNYRKMKQEKKHIEPLKYISSYVILTTTDCNARCFYCYEKGCEKVAMTEETAEKIVDFIIKHRDPENPNEPIKISWFGGEPLYNKNVISLICGKLKGANIPMSNEITSNGILFDEMLVKKAKYDWNINNVQITIDGTQDVYNKVKNYIYKDIKNPYEVVLNNIKYLSDNDIPVSIRLNLGLYNYEDIKKLIEDIYKRFGNNKNIIPYAHEIFDDPKHPRTEEQTKELYNKLSDIFEVLDKYGYSKKNIGGESIWEHACMADSGTALLINPKGQVGLCEHYSDKHLIGDIDTFDEKVDWEEVSLWQEKSHYSVCENCPVYPYCYTVKLCGGDPCNKYARESQIIRYKIELRNLIRQVDRLNSPVLHREYDTLINDFSHLYDRHDSLVGDVSRLYERMNEMQAQIDELEKKLGIKNSEEEKATE